MVVSNYFLFKDRFVGSILISKPFLDVFLFFSE